MKEDLQALGGLDLLPLPLCVCDASGSVLFANWAAARVAPCASLPSLGDLTEQSHNAWGEPLLSWTERVNAKR